MGKYLVQQEIYSNVFLASDEFTGVSVLIKKNEGDVNNPNLISSAKAEVDLMKKCSHDGLPVIIECFELEGKNGIHDFCIVIKYEQGISIKFLNGEFGILNQYQIKKVFFDLLDILHFIHQKNMIHR